MKKIAIFLLTSILLTFTSCSTEPKPDDTPGIFLDSFRGVNFDTYERMYSTLTNLENNTAYYEYLGLEYGYRAHYLLREIYEGERGLLIPNIEHYPLVTEDAAIHMDYSYDLCVPKIVYTVHHEKTNKKADIGILHIDVHENPQIAAENTISKIIFLLNTAFPTSNSMIKADSKYSNIIEHKIVLADREVTALIFEETSPNTPKTYMFLYNNVIISITPKGLTLPDDFFADFSLEEFISH